MTDSENCTRLQRIYLSPPHMSGDEQALLSEVFELNWVAPAGPHLDQFESRMAKHIGVCGAVAVSSGTAALHLALRHLNLQPDDEVLCSTLTFCASANPIFYEGAQPVFLDSEPDSWNLDPNILAEELTCCSARGKLPRAVVVVDVFGQSADMDAIEEIASRYEIPVIEDAAEGLGATYKDRQAGSSGWASFFSFNGNKIITAGGGGMLCSNDQTLLDHAKFLSTQARDHSPHYQHSEIGFNYRMSNVLAAIGLGQLNVLEQRVEARRRNFEFYRQELEDISGISLMPEHSYGRSSRWLTVVQIDPETFGASSEEVRLKLEAENIESRPVWKPLHLQPVFAGCRKRGGALAERLFRNGLCLPSGSALTEADLARIVSAIRSAGASALRGRRSSLAA